MYSCLTRSSPLAANQRIKNDLLIPAVKLGKEYYSQSLLEIIDKCLSLDYLERPQSLLALQKLLLASNLGPDQEKKTSLVNKIVEALNKPISIKQKPKK